MNATKIIIHCSASPNGKAVPLEEIRRWHIARGMKDVGYHLIIQPDGTVDKGRDLKSEGAHCLGENHCAIGVCLIGTDKFTLAQFHALEKQLDMLLLTLQSMPHHAIYCHYQFPSAQKQGKTCPNININRLLHWYHMKDDNTLAPYLLKETKC